MKGEALGRDLRLRGRKEITQVLQHGIRVQHQGITLFFCLVPSGSLPCSPGKKSAEPWPGTGIGAGCERPFAGPALNGRVPAN